MFTWIWECTWVQVPTEVTGLGAGVTSTRGLPAAGAYIHQTVWMSNKYYPPQSHPFHPRLWFLKWRVNFPSDKGWIVMFSFNVNLPQVRTTKQGAQQKNRPHRLNWGGKTHLEQWWILLAAAQVGRHDRRTVCLFLIWPSLLPLCWCAMLQQLLPSLRSQPTSLTKDQQHFRNLPGTQHQLHGLSNYHTVSLSSLRQTLWAVPLLEPPSLKILSFSGMKQLVIILM